jgi:hypothetical protein
MRKSICSSRHPLRIFAVAALLLSATHHLSANEAAPTNGLPKFLGAASCSSSGCHGGGGPHQNQYLIWALRDFHSQRPVATLTTARSKQIGDALQIKDPTAERRCTGCHAPLREVPESRRGENFKVSEGVSCESCHGPAENWLRSHTRHDYTHADRVAVGMRDLKNLYVRANTCVACHQNVDNDILAAGHPELIFELDGQSISEPKHWRETTNWNGAQAWLVGQAVALREMSWQLTNGKPQAGNLKSRWEGLHWLVTESSGANLSFPVMPAGSYLPGGFEKAVQSWSDAVAKKAAAIVWTDDMTRKVLSILGSSSPDFHDSSVPQSQQARRAERLVLALDRLTLALPKPEQSEALNTALKKLFADAQSLPDFQPATFAEHLKEFQKVLSEPPASH